MLTLVLMLMLGVNDAIETNVFLSSVKARVNADARCGLALTQYTMRFVVRIYSDIFCDNLLVHFLLTHTGTLSESRLDSRYRFLSKDRKSAFN